MTPEQRETILHALWPDGAKPGLGVWGILDCARDPKIYAALLESRLEFRCLYSGRLPRALEMVAPHLVELFPTNRLTARWLDEGWGQDWGVFVKIDDPSNLRHHLRKLLRVVDTSGRRLLLRFYDPRVFGPFARTCNGEQLGAVFGPVAHWLAEEPGSGALTEFRHDRGVLRERVLSGTGTASAAGVKAR